VYYLDMTSNQVQMLGWSLMYYLDMTSNQVRSDVRGA
jgi:hypothetical protein